MSNVLKIWCMHPKHMFESGNPHSVEDTREHFPTGNVGLVYISDLDAHAPLHISCSRGLATGTAQYERVERMYADGGIVQLCSDASPTRDATLAAYRYLNRQLDEHGAREAVRRFQQRKNRFRI